MKIFDISGQTFNAADLHTLRTSHHPGSTLVISNEASALSVAHVVDHSGVGLILTVDANDAITGFVNPDYVIERVGQHVTLPRQTLYDALVALIEDRKKVSPVIEYDLLRADQQVPHWCFIHHKYHNHPCQP
jgi:hypothetical protein